MKVPPFARCFVLLAAAAQWSAAQSTFIGATNGTSQWTNPLVWSGGVLPNATDAIVVFTNIAVTNGLQWQGTNFTAGTVNFQNASGNVVFGDNAVATDTLTLATTAGKPVLNVSNANGTAFIYATLLGTNGFTKTGAGNLTFRFNTTDMSYTGDVNLNAGSLTLQKDRNLGDTNNDLIVGGNSTLAINPSTAGNITLSAGRSISLSNGTRLTVTVTSANSPNVTIAGDISGGGALTKGGADTLTLAGANSYTGGTVVSAGRLAGSTTSLQGAITNSATVAFDQATNGTYAGAMSGSGLLVKSGAGTVTLGGANSYSGGTLVSAGRLAGSTTSLQGAITNNAAVAFDQATNGTYSGAMSGSGLLVKSGAGTVTLGGANSYSGGTLVSAGLLAASTATLQGAVTNNAGVSFDQTTNGTYAGAMSGNGSLTKAGAGTVTLAGANTYSGATTISAGRLELSGSGAISTGNLVFSGTAPGSLSLGGKSQSVANISSIFTSAGTVVIAGGGSLTINGDAHQTFGNALNGTVWDVSGLDAFAFSRTNREFVVRPATAAGSVTNTFNMAATGDGLNTISASRVVFGAASGGSTGSNHLGVVNLGRTNTINTDAFEIGGFNGAGSVAFGAAVTNASPVLVLRAADGSSRLASMVVGWTSSGVNDRQGNGTLNLTGGSVDGLVGTLTIGRQGANATSLVSGTFTMQAGALDVTTLILADKTTNSGASTMNGTFNQSGGSVSATTLYLGNNQSNSLANFVANYNLNGGSLLAQSIAANGADYGAGTVRNLNVNGGTVRNMAGADLSINGLTNTVAGRINVVLGASGGAFLADAGRAITVGANALISGSGGLSKQGGGTLTLASSNTYTGSTSVQDGTLVVNGALASSGVTVESGGTLAGSGSLGLTTIQAGGTISPGNSPGTLTLTNGLAWNSGGHYNWQIYDATGAAGTGWDLIDVTGGSWDITGLSTNTPFHINLWSLSGTNPDTGGAALNFNSAQNYSWKILAANSITGSFSSGLFAINTGATNGTGGFAGANGLFALSVDGSNDLFLTYTPGAQPVPEPGTWAAGAVLVAVGYARWRRRKFVS